MSITQAFLVDTYKTVISCSSHFRAVENVQCKLKRTKETLSQRLQYTHPILSRIEPWMRDKLRKAEVVFTTFYWY